MIQRLLSVTFRRNLPDGYHITLEIGEEGHYPKIRRDGSLPFNPLLIETANTHWENYRGFGEGHRKRASNSKKSGKFDRNRGISIHSIQVGSVSPISKCKQSEKELRNRLNQWLRSDSFQACREEILPHIQETDTIRLLIKTDDPELAKIPWEDWDFLKRYGDRIGVSFSFATHQSCDRPQKQIASDSLVKILAIFGNSDGIDTQPDRDILETLAAQFPQKIDLRIISEPKPEDFGDRLWEDAWDIIFFAGHSVSKDDEGAIYLSGNQSVPINNFWHGLKKAVDRGLQLAIFNSCDGLGIARKLDDTLIPQAIVMRELVPDEVAQTFIKHLLKALTQGMPVHLAVAHAKKRLMELNEQYPCASWLPVIYQNPAELPCNLLDLSEIIEAASIEQSDVVAKQENKRGLNWESSFQIFRFKYRAIVLLILSAIGIWGFRELSSTALNRYGLALLRQETPNKKTAIQSFKLALALKKDNPSALNNLGLVYEYLDELEIARKYYEESKKMGNWAGCSNEARLNIIQGSSDKDLQMIQKAEQLLFWSCLDLARNAKRKPGEYPEYLVLKNLGLARIEQKNYTGAIEVLQDAIAMRPDEGIAYCFMAETLQAQGQALQAVEHWKSCDRYGKNRTPEEINLRKKAREILTKNNVKNYNNRSL